MLIVWGDGSRYNNDNNKEQKNSGKNKKNEYLHKPQ